MRQLKIQKSITNRNSEALDKYLVEIGRAPMISIEEEIELAQQIRKGGRVGERAKNIIRNHILVARMSDTKPHAPVRRPDMSIHRPQTVMASMAAALLGFNLAR